MPDLPDRPDQPDPEAQQVLDAIEAMDAPEMHELPPEQARAALEGALSGGEPAAGVAHVADEAVPGPESDLPVRVYRADDAAERWEGPPPTVAYFHGGGFVLGDLDTHDDTARVLADRSGAVVVSVDYRLAPEHPFPAAVEDAYHAASWLGENAEEFGGDPDRLAVVGTSAGGTLSAVVALLARDCRRAGDAVGRFFPDLPPAPDLAHQTLIYPATSYGRVWPSYEASAEGYFLTLAEMEYFGDHYLAHRLHGFNRYAYPLNADDHADLPPATVVTAGFDPLRDEGAAYAAAMADAGVPVEHRDYPGMIHGFASMLGPFEVSAAREALSAVAGDLRASFE